MDFWPWKNENHIQQGHSLGHLAHSSTFITFHWLKRFLPDHWWDWCKKQLIIWHITPSYIPALVKKRVQLVRTVETFRYTSESSFVHEVEQVLSESHSLSALDAMGQPQMFILNSHKVTVLKSLFSKSSSSD